MSTIDLRREHHLDHAEARARAERMAADLSARYEVSHHWEGDVLHFDRSGVHGSIEVAQSHIRVLVKLGFLAGMFQERIEQSIKKNLDELVA